MGKFYLKTFLLGIFVMIISSAITAVIFTILCLFTSSFNVIVIYIVGGIIGLICTILLSKIFLKTRSYFELKEIDNPNQNNIWIQRIKENRYVKRWTAYLAYLPSFILSIAIIAVYIVFYKTFLNFSDTNIWYSIICAILGASSISLLLFTILGIKSFKICKICGAVNAIIYDKEIDHIATVSFGDYRVPAGLRGAGDMSSIRARTENHGDSMLCHCASCKKEIVITETLDSRWSGL